MTGFGNTTTLERTISIKDTTLPNITLDPATINRFTNDELNPKHGVKIDGDSWTQWNNRPGHTVTYNDTGLNLSIAGTYKIIYTATDDSGNSQIQERPVVVSTPQNVTTTPEYVSQPGQIGAVAVAIGNASSSSAREYDPTLYG